MTNTTTVKNKEHTLWSNYPYDLNFDDWKNDLTEYYPELDESELKAKMYEINDSWITQKNVQRKQTIKINYERNMLYSKYDALLWQA